MSRYADIGKRIARIDAAETNDFIELVHISGLDPAIHFRYATLEGVDFSHLDLFGFDFTGARMRGCNFDGARISPENFKDAELDDNAFANIVNDGDSDKKDTSVAQHFTKSGIRFSPGKAEDDESIEEQISKLEEIITNNPEDIDSLKIYIHFI